MSMCIVCVHAENVCCAMKCVRLACMRMRVCARFDLSYAFDDVHAPRVCAFVYVCMGFGFVCVCV